MPWWGWLFISLGAVGWGLVIWFFIWLSRIELFR